MSSDWSTISSAVISVFAVIGIGVVVRRVGWLTEEADQSLFKVIVNVLFPCLIFSTVSGNAALRGASNLVLPPVVGFASLMVGIGVACGVVALGRRLTGLTDSRQRRTFALSAALYNYGFVPIPLVAVLFDDRTLGVLFIYNVGMTLAMWSVGVTLLGGKLGRRWWLRLLNPPTIAILVSLGYNYLQTTGHPAAFVTETVQWLDARVLTWLGQAAIPMSLVMVGATIADELRTTENTFTVSQTAKIVWWACLLRLGILPVAFLLFALFVPASEELKRVLVVEAAMPSAVFGVLLSRHYQGDVGVALRVVLGTSLASLITIPLWISLGWALLDLAG